MKNRFKETLENVRCLPRALWDVNVFRDVESALTVAVMIESGELVDTAEYNIRNNRIEQEAHNNLLEKLKKELAE